MEFRQKVKEALGYYVYALVDPRNSKIKNSAFQTLYIQSVC